MLHLGLGFRVVGCGCGEAAGGVGGADGRPEPAAGPGGQAAWRAGVVAFPHHHLPREPRHSAAPPPPRPPPSSTSIRARQRAAKSCQKHVFPPCMHCRGFSEHDRRACILRLENIRNYQADGRRVPVLYDPCNRTGSCVFWHRSNRLCPPLQPRAPGVPALQFVRRFVSVITALMEALL